MYIYTNIEICINMFIYTNFKFLYTNVYIYKY